MAARGAAPWTALAGREITMRRRQFIALLGGVSAWPQAVLAQTRKRRLVGWLYLSRNELVARYLGLVLDGLRELGQIEGRDFEMVYRSADGLVERLPRAAEELVQLNPDIIIASATIQAVAVKKATDTIPIVVAVLADPVGLGFVASEARPGGNVTGIAPYVKGLPAKQLELAREVVPGATRIGLVDDVNDPKAHPQRREIEAGGKELEIKIVPAEVRTASDIGSAYEALAAGGVEVVVVEQSTMLIVARKEIAEAAAAKKLPTVYGYREHVEAGGLISYGVNLNSCFHRAAYYVDKILKGAKPGDLPVEFPTKIELVINLKTAKSLALQISPTLLARADEVIE
jgi:putative ABC transport system substrate-binding protein